jgi:hypothetical protein
MRNLLLAFPLAAIAALAAPTMSFAVSPPAHPATIQACTPAPAESLTYQAGMDDSDWTPGADTGTNCQVVKHSAQTQSGTLMLTPTKKQVEHQG